MGGRPPKPTEVLKSQGTWRGDLHGDRVEFGHSEIPDMPADMPPQAARFWRDVVATMPSGVLATIDWGLLESCCRWLDRYLVADKAIDAAPQCVTTLNYACKCHQEFLKASAKLGLTPVDRARLKKPSAEPKEDGLAALKVVS